MLRRHIEPSVLAALDDTPVVLLNGARQVGKTTLAQAVGGARDAEYLTLDDAATVSAAMSDPTGFVNNLPDRVVIDEIQRAPDLFPAIKLAVDRNRTPGRFLLTGSANVLTLPRLGESLAGRMEVVSLFPFSVGEAAQKREGFLPRLFQNAFRRHTPARSSDSLSERIARGGYPEVVQRDTGDRRSAWFASYLSTILQRDVRDLARIDALHAMPNLLGLCAARSAGLLNLADIGRDAGLPYTSLTRYLTLLETVFLVYRLPAWSANFGQRLVKAPKLYVMDTGLACHLLSTEAKRLDHDRSLFGRLLETFVVGELRKQMSWVMPTGRVYHFRSAVGAEVDVVIERTDGDVAAVEVKAGATVDASCFRGLTLLRDRLGTRFLSGVVLHTGERTIPFGDRLWAVPIQALWAA